MAWGTPRQAGSVARCRRPSGRSRGSSPRARAGSVGDAPTQRPPGRSCGRSCCHRRFAKGRGWAEHRRVVGGGVERSSRCPRAEPGHGSSWSSSWHASRLASRRGARRTARAIEAGGLMRRLRAPSAPENNYTQPLLHHSCTHPAAALLLQEAAAGSPLLKRYDLKDFY